MNNFYYGLLLLLSISNTAFSQLAIYTLDSMALVELYNTTNGASWKNNTNWLKTPVSSWHGVSVYANRVTKIELANNNLKGSLPSLLGELTELTELNLSNNLIADSIPSTELQTLQKLENLNLSNNQMYSAIPNEIMYLKKLSYFKLNNNTISGSIPLALGNLSELVSLELQNNQLSDPIPDTLYSLKKLNYLGLEGNQLSGQISPYINKLKNLEYIYLGNNQFSGDFPAIDSLTILKELDISLNQFENFPDVSLLNLMGLYLSDNKFTFEDIEPNITAASVMFLYSPQDSVKNSFQLTANIGDTLLFIATVKGANNIYQWYKNDTLLNGENNDTLKIYSVGNSDEGIYTCKITNSIATDLTLKRRPIQVTVNNITSV